MFWVLLATGCTGAWTLSFLARLLREWWSPPTSLSSHFSPHGGCTDVVVRELAAARHEVLVLAYSFSARPIAQALIDAKLRGVHVEVILDHSNEKEEYSELHFLSEQGLAPLIDSEHAIAHNKVMIIDKRTVLTGSFNFTQQAEAHNAENLLVIKHHPEILAAYRADFFKHKEHARNPQVVPQMGARTTTAPHAHGTSTLGHGTAHGTAGHAAASLPAPTTKAA